MNGIGLSAACGERLEAMYVLAVTTGLRQGELLGFGWEDVDLEVSKLSVRQTLVAGSVGSARGPVFSNPKRDKSRRRVSLTSTAMEALKRHKAMQNEERLRLGTLWEDHDLVFPNRVGKPMDHNNLYHREYMGLLQRAGLEDEGFTFHSLRHTFATELFNQRKRPKIIQYLLGHSSIVQTMDTYSHLLDDVDGDEVGGLDEAFG